MRRGDDTQDRVPGDHALRVVRRLADRALQELSPRFGAMYPAVGDPSIVPERLLRALLLQGLYTVRSERQHVSYGPRGSLLIPVALMSGEQLVLVLEHRGSVSRRFGAMLELAKGGSPRAEDTRCKGADKGCGG